VRSAAVTAAVHGPPEERSGAEPNLVPERQFPNFSAVKWSDFCTHIGHWLRARNATAAHRAQPAEHCTRDIAVRLRHANVLRELHTSHALPFARTSSGPTLELHLGLPSNLNVSANLSRLCTLRSMREILGAPARANHSPIMRRAEGLISVTIVRRTLVAYWEVAVISGWRSERARTSCIEYEASMTDASEINRGLIQRSPPQVYDLVAHRLGASRSDHRDDSCPDYKEGAD